jgi:hypothetical protein
MVRFSIQIEGAAERMTGALSALSEKRRYYFLINNVRCINMGGP